MRILPTILLFLSNLFGANNVISNYEKEYLGNSNSFYRLSNPSFKAQYFTNEGFRAAKFGANKFAKTLFYKACIMGDELACVMFNDMSGKKLDSMSNMNDNCALNSTECFKKYGSYLKEDILDDFKIKWYLSKSCKLGSMEACILESLKIRPYVYDRRQELANACNYDYAQACYKLAHIYLFGKDTTRNIKLAISLMKKSCNIGFKKACVDYIMLLSRR